MTTDEGAEAAVVGEVVVAVEEGAAAGVEVAVEVKEAEAEARAATDTPATKALPAPRCADCLVAADALWAPKKAERAREGWASLGAEAK